MFYFPDWVNPLAPGEDIFKAEGDVDFPMNLWVDLQTWFFPVPQDVSRAQAI